VFGDGCRHLRTDRLYVCVWLRLHLGVLIRDIILILSLIVAMARYPWRTLLLASAVGGLALGLIVGGCERLFGATDIAKARVWAQRRTALYALHEKRSSLSRYT
jgi:uncharacterized MnhB-related membrane protein